MDLQALFNQIPRDLAIDLWVDTLGALTICFIYDEFTHLKETKPWIHSQYSRRIVHYWDRLRSLNNDKKNELYKI